MDFHSEVNALTNQIEKLECTEDDDDAEKILNLSRTLCDLQDIIRIWPDDKALDEINMNICTFWIQAFGIPVCFINPTTSQLIGETVQICYDWP